MLSSVCFDRCIRSCSHRYSSDTEEFQFSKVMVLIFTPTSGIQNGFYCSTSSPAFATIHLLHFCHPGNYLLDFHSDYNWNFSLTMKWGTFSSAYQHLNIFCEEPFELFCPYYIVLLICILFTVCLQVFCQKNVMQIYSPTLQLSFSLIMVSYDK